MGEQVRSPSSPSEVVNGQTLLWDFLPTHKRDYDPSQAMQAFSAMIGVTFFIAFAMSFYVFLVKPPGDIFVQRALTFLLIALFIRVTMSTKIALIDSHQYSNRHDGQYNVDTNSIPWQQIYFELPFYFFLIVPLSLLFSWRLAYLKIGNFIKGKGLDIDRTDTHDGTIEVLSEVDSQIFDSVESLDHIIDSAIMVRRLSNAAHESQNESQIVQPLLEPRASQLRRDRVQKHTRLTEGSLSTIFRVLVTTITVTSLGNTGMVLYHMQAGPGSDSTGIYKLGQVIYFVFFIVLFAIQLGVFIDGFVIYYHWRRLIVTSETNSTGSQTGSPTSIQDSQIRLESIRILFKPQISKMNAIFVYLQGAATIRLVVYVVLRFQSQTALIDWIAIDVKYFLIIYASELWITVGLFIFVFDSIKNIEKSQVSADQTNDYERAYTAQQTVMLEESTPQDKQGRRQSETESEPDEDQVKDWVQKQKQVLGIEGNDSSEQEEGVLDRASVQSKQEGSLMRLKHQLDPNKAFYTPLGRVTQAKLSKGRAMSAFRDIDGNQI